MEPGLFVRGQGGGPSQNDRKKFWQLLVLNFYRGLNERKTFIGQGSREGQKFFRVGGRSNFSQGVQLLILLKNYRTSDFPGDLDPNSPQPPWIHAWLYSNKNVPLRLTLSFPAAIVKENKTY